MKSPSVDGYEESHSEDDSISQLRSKLTDKSIELIPGTSFNKLIKDVDEELTKVKTVPKPRRNTIDLNN